MMRERGAIHSWYDEKPGGGASSEPVGKCSNAAG